MPTRRLVPLVRPALAVVLTTLFPAGGSAQEPVSLEEVAALPFSSNLTSGPGEAVIAWTTRIAGVGNLWIAEAPAYEGRQLTRFPDDGRIGSIRIVLGGKAVIFSRDGEFWMVATDGGTPRRLPEIGSPAVSPSGDVVAYARAGGLWTLSLDDLTPRRRATVASPAAVRWSPDGTRLAFESRRGDHRFVGILGLADSSIVWMSPGVDRDQDAVWSPDGRQIAFLRVPSEREWRVFFPRRGHVPWSIRVGDPATGESREIWRASAGAGSVYQDVGAENDILWAAGGRIIFPWEGDGWLHLYSVPASGGSPVLLTPGEFEVAEMALSSDGRDVLLTSNQGDLDRRRIWRVPAAGGRPELLTTGEGLAWDPEGLADGGLAFIAASGRRAAHVQILRPRTTTTTRPAPELPGARDFPIGSLVEPHSVSFPAADGTVVRGQIYTRPGPEKGRPAVVFLHGGPQNQTLLGFGRTDLYHYWSALVQHLASRGYVVLSLNYRGGTGYGRAYREVPAFGPAGASEHQDVVAAARYLRELPEVDSARIGVMGGSYGGLLTNLALSRNSDLFAAGVNVNGIYDWNALLTSNHGDYRPEAEPEISRTAHEASPVASVHLWRSPVLVVHGDRDQAVPFQQSSALAEDLRARGVPVELVILPDEGHVFDTHATWLRVWHAAVEFLDRTLRD